MFKSFKKMGSFFFALLVLMPLVQAFQRATDESIIKECRSLTISKSLNVGPVMGNSCCIIMLDDLYSIEKDVLNCELFKKAFIANGLPDPGNEQYAYYKLYSCKYDITSLNESSMFLAPFIHGIHAKLMRKYHCTSRDNCKYQSNDTSTLVPELWGWNIVSWVKPSYSTVEDGRFGGMVNFLLENKGCKHLGEVLDIYKRIRLIFGLPEEQTIYGCTRRGRKRVL